MRPGAKHTSIHLFRGRRPGAVKRSGLGRSGWIAAAALMVLSGAVASVLAARAVAANDMQKSQRAFAATSADVASTLKLAIQHEEDLVVSTSAFIVTDPNMSNETFNKWLRTDRALARYPEILGVVHVVVVPASQLPAYKAKALETPVGVPAPDGSFQIVPPGKRPFYCFVALRSHSQLDNAAPIGYDACGGRALAGMISSRDSGLGTYQPFRVGTRTLLGVQTPIYRGGVLPTTIEGRRATFLGWIGTGLMPSVILIKALENHPATAVALHYAEGSSAVTFRSGQPPAGAEKLTTNLHNGWTVETLGTVSGGSMFFNENALALLVAGVALSMLLGILGVVLATGRARALRLVSEQTVELHDQAAELRTSVVELKAAQAVKDEFLALVSHELRTPLTSIQGYTEMLKEGENSDDQRRYLEVIDRNAANVLSLVEDLLIMAQIQSGGLPLQLGEVMLSDLIARSSEAARPFATSKKIGLDVMSEPGIATQGDVQQLGQVMDNLVSNAIKYTPVGGGVSITMTHAEETATIAIRDTGIGIPQDEQDRVFGRFFRTSNARVSGIKGTGLGLAITRAIVEAHGGTIAFESVEGTGSTFRITLPRASASNLASAV